MILRKMEFGWLGVDRDSLNCWIYKGREDRVGEGGE